MNKRTKAMITFVISFIIAFLVVGYAKNTMFRIICWVEGVTIWDKFREYYIRTFSDNIMPSFILAIVFTSILIFAGRNKS